MNWPNLLSLTLAYLVLAFALLRVERKRRWVVIVFLEIPVFIGILLWADFRQQWPETLVGFVSASGLASVWWFTYGRKLPPPTSDNIAVWGEEDLKIPKPKPAQLQAEIERLRADNEQLEAELRKLKGDSKSNQ